MPRMARVPATRYPEPFAPSRFDAAAVIHEEQISVNRGRQCNRRSFTRIEFRQ